MHTPQQHMTPHDPLASWLETHFPTKTHTDDSVQNRHFAHYRHMPCIAEVKDGARLHKQRQKRPLTSFALCPRLGFWVLADLVERDAGSAPSLQAQIWGGHTKERLLPPVAWSSGRTCKQHDSTSGNTGEWFYRNGVGKKVRLPPYLPRSTPSACFSGAESACLHQLDIM